MLTILAFFLTLIAIWELLVRSHIWSIVLMPPPRMVVEYLLFTFHDGSLPQAIFVSLRRLVTGYTIGLLLGIPLGQLMARYASCKSTLGLLALGLQALPSVCWVPLALLWFGQTETSMLFVVVMGSLWSIAIATDNGVRTIPPIYAKAARTMGSRGLHSLLTITLPASMPVMVSGMKQGWAFAWRSLMAAEVYVTILSGFGLGHLLHYGRELNAMEQVLGIIFIIMACGLIVDKCIFSPLEHSLYRRWGTN